MYLSVDNLINNIEDNAEETHKEGMMIVNDSNINKEFQITTTPIVSIEKLIEFDLHMGLKTNLWNPKMEDFIYKKSNHRHIIDIRKSIHFLNKAYLYVSDVVRAGIDVVFVCVKNKNISNIVKNAAQRVNAYYVTQRWLGGLLTNFKQLSKIIKKLNDLEQLLENNELTEKYTKKELIQLNKEKNKLNKFYSGIKNLNKLPGLLILFDPIEDHCVITEAKKMGIPIVSVANTNSDPSLIDFIIPGNNKSPKSIYLIANLLCDVLAEVNGNKILIANKADKDIFMPEEYKKNNTENNNSNMSVERGYAVIS